MSLVLPVLLHNVSNKGKLEKTCTNSGKGISANLELETKENSTNCIILLLKNSKKTTAFIRKIEIITSKKLGLLTKIIFQRGQAH